MRSKTSIYPEFEVILRKTLEQPPGEHLGRTGKNGMAVLNAIRNKLVLRVVSVVNNQMPYVNYTKTAA